MIYERGVKKYILFYKVKEKGKKSGLTENMIELKRKGIAWVRMKKKAITEQKKNIN